MVIAMQQKRLRTVGEFLVVGICVLAFSLTSIGICALIFERNAPGSDDFVEYWASGQQILHHANPYDGQAILALERSNGFPPNIPVLIMWNPPPALALVLPLGLVGPRVGQLLWSMLLVVCLITSVRMVWTMHGCPKDRLHLLGYSFAPALACVLAGQVSIFILLGLVLFLHWHESRPLMAGLSLWLCMLKPHLFLPFGMVLLVWAIRTRRYKILVGAMAALCASSEIASLYDSQIWSHYGQMVRVARITEVIPCLSIIFRLIFSRDSVWLQYLPAAIACMWALAYFQKHHERWDWLEHGSLLMLVSVMVAPYAWLMDQAILIPALLHAAFCTRSRTLISVLAMASALIEIGALRGFSLLHSTFYLWTSPAWLAWYLCATKPGCVMKVYARLAPVSRAQLES